MPNDLYMWEGHGGLVHHCPHCKKPLNTPQARSRCLGEHVEWCKMYHTQLFKKGTSGQCAPCHSSAQEHLKRCREIAEKVQELKHVRAGSSLSSSQPAAKDINSLSQETSEQSPSIKKRERKAVKKAQKIALMAKSVTTAELDLVANVLQSSMDPETSGLAEYENVKENMAFHKGTVDVRETRKAIKKGGDGGKPRDHQVSSESIDGILQLLDVTPLPNTTVAKERTIISELRKKIGETLIKIHQEQDEMAMRRAGFWRWASKKAYKRLQSNGGIWGKKDSDLLSAVKAEAEESFESSATGSTDDLETETDPTESDTGADTLRDEDATDENVCTTSTVSKELRTPTPAELSATNDGWTTVSTKSSKASAKHKPAVGKLVLVHNKGLEKLAQSPVNPWSPKFSPILSRFFGGQR